MNEVSEQIELCRKHGAAYLPPDASQKIGIAIATLDMLPLNALRVLPENGTCGWYIWGGEVMFEDADFFDPMHVQHLTEHYPKLIPYLALGPGWRVLLAPGHEDVWFDAALCK